MGQGVEAAEFPLHAFAVEDVEALDADSGGIEEGVGGVPGREGDDLEAIAAPPSELLLIEEGGNEISAQEAEGSGDADPLHPSKYSLPERRQDALA